MLTDIEFDTPEPLTKQGSLKPRANKITGTFRVLKIKENV